MTAEQVRALAGAAGLELPDERVEPTRALLEQVLAAVTELEASVPEDVEPLLDVP